MRLNLLAAVEHDRIWTMDFMNDALYSGRRFRTFNVLFESNRAALSTEIGTSVPSARVIRVLVTRVLDAYLFESIEQVQLLTNDWLTVYIHERPHEGLGRVPPLMFMPRQTSGASS